MAALRGQIYIHMYRWSRCLKVPVAESVAWSSRALPTTCSFLCKRGHMASSLVPGAVSYRYNPDYLEKGSCKLSGNAQMHQNATALQVCRRDDSGPHQSSPCSTQPCCPNLCGWSSACILTQEDEVWEGHSAQSYTVFIIHSVHPQNVNFQCNHQSARVAQFPSST